MAAVATSIFGPLLRRLALFVFDSSFPSLCMKIEHPLSLRSLTPIGSVFGEPDLIPFGSSVLSRLFLRDLPDSPAPSDLFLHRSATPDLAVSLFLCLSSTDETPLFSPSLTSEAPLLYWYFLFEDVLPDCDPPANSPRSWIRTSGQTRQSLATEIRPQSFLRVDLDCRGHG